MSYYKNKGKRFKGRKTLDYLNDTTFKDQGKPTDEGQLKFGLAIKAMKGLPHSSISVKADPYADSLPTANPYAIINRFNKLIGGKYAGDDNIDGGNVQQYANSNLSAFLKYADFGKVHADVNYKYVPMIAQLGKGAQNKPFPLDHFPGKALINEMRRAISEAVSIMQSTTFTNMAINSFKVETDMPLGDTGVTLSNDGVGVYSNLTDVLYACLMMYQLILQETLNCFKWHNSFRLKMGTMIRSSWNRETPRLNSLFGLFNKKSFISMMNSLAMCFEGEYCDLDFSEQSGLINITPSRRSNSITDPVLEVVTNFALPKKFRIYIEKTVSGETVQVDIFNLDKLSFPVRNSEGGLVNVKFTDACCEFNELLSAESTMEWARDYNASIGEAVDRTGETRFNRVKALLTVIQQSITYFKTNMADVREALDVTTRAGITTWTKGYKPAVVKDSDCGIFRNLIVDDVIKNMFSGCKTVKFNNVTKRWSLYSMWNMYDGIPEYDMKSGGAFLSFSFKGIDDKDDPDYLVDYIMRPFSTDNDTTKYQMDLVTRDGQRVTIKGGEIAQPQQDNVVSRLFPLPSQADQVLRVADVDLTINTQLDAATRSTLYKTLTQIFGMCTISDGEAITDVSLDPDIIAIYQIEIEDITNESIKYARTKGPFRGAAESETVIGFKH